MLTDAYGTTIKSFRVRVLRQDAPGQPPYWQTFDVPYEPDMNVISVLQQIAAHPRTADGQATTPVAWDCGCLEEVCGACTMVINGRVRQSCSALVDRLLTEQPQGITLEPMSKFPVVRDLMVDRGRMFQALQKVRAWVPVDGYYDLGPGPRQSRAEQEVAYPLSECMSCGCCLEACPQYAKVEISRESGESEESYQLRLSEAYDKSFIGAHAISQAMLFNAHPVGKWNAGERLEALTHSGGIQVCGNAQNCVAVCPKNIPLTTSIARAGRAVNWHKLRQLFGW
ncbi:MAG TPA: succinate dehydrogenase iron-sulfur subunit [Pirellulaceae bacterium]|nr:succinate dehydrogenase iron-sulfur subunit [Pirellulaceae bacterium]